MGTVWYCICKGARLEYYIRRGIYEANNPNEPKRPPGPDNPNTPSIFNDPDVALAGYQVVGPEKKFFPVPYNEVSGALSGLEVANQESYRAWAAFVRALFQTSNLNALIDNLQYPFMMASHKTEFNTLMSPSDGVIIVIGTTSISEYVDVPAALPQRVSDVVFLGWKKLCATPKKPIDALKYVIHAGVTNNDTRTVMDKYVPEKNEEGQPLKWPWPGKKFTLPDVEALALLGTPNGSGVEWMLLQHQAAFGNKKVQNVTVFDNMRWGRSMLLTLDIETNLQRPNVADFPIGPIGKGLPLDPVP